MAHFRNRKISYQQCDQIGLLLKEYVNKICYKSSPKIDLLSILKMLLLDKTTVAVIIFGQLLKNQATFIITSGHTGYQVLSFKSRIEVKNSLFDLSKV